MGKYIVKLSFEYEIEVPNINVGNIGENITNNISDEQYNIISSKIYKIMENENYADAITDIIAADNNFMVDVNKISKWFNDSIHDGYFGYNAVSEIRNLQSLQDKNFDIDDCMNDLEIDISQYSTVMAILSSLAKDYLDNYEF